MACGLDVKESAEKKGNGALSVSHLRDDLKVEGDRIEELKEVEWTNRQTKDKCKYRYNLV